MYGEINRQFWQLVQYAGSSPKVKKLIDNRSRQAGNIQRLLRPQRIIFLPSSSQKKAGWAPA